jgi:hypothetical protein
VTLAPATCGVPMRGSPHRPPPTRHTLSKLMREPGSSELLQAISTL